MLKLINCASASKLPCQVFSLDIKNISKGYSATNPSICSYDNNLFVMVRAYAFTNHSKGSWNIDNKNYLLKLDRDFNSIAFDQLLYPHLENKVFENTSFGFEDSRIFVWNDKLWSLSTARSLSEHNLHQMVLSEIELNNNSTRFLNCKIISPQSVPPRHEKNWMPAIRQNQLFFVYFHDPYIVLNSEGKAIISIEKSIPTQFRGGAQLIPLLEGYLSVVHEVVKINFHKKVYFHRFVFYDKSLILKSFSDPFYLFSKGIEFVAGLCLEEGSKNLLASFGVKDKLCKIARIDVNYVFDSLKNIVD